MEKLNRWMDENKVSAAALARRIGRSEAAVSRIRSGQTRSPGMSTILRIRDASAGAIQPEDWEAEQRSRPASA